jgi:hypothetical protein
LTLVQALIAEPVVQELATTSQLRITSMTVIQQSPAQCLLDLLWSHQVLLQLGMLSLLESATLFNMGTAHLTHLSKYRQMRAIGFPLLMRQLRIVIGYGKQHLKATADLRKTMAAGVRMISILASVLTLILLQMDVELLLVHVVWLT